MRTLRQYNEISLKAGAGQSAGAFNLSAYGNAVTVWFNAKTKDFLLSLTDKEFEEESKEMLNDEF